jgi:predicted dehydrogenase
VPLNVLPSVTGKPGCTTLGQLEEVWRTQATTERIWPVCFLELLPVHAVTRAAELIIRGAIGRVVNVVGLGPHRLNKSLRPAWFLDHALWRHPL